MSAHTPANLQATVIPAMRYRDAHAAIQWLQNSLGFTTQAVYDGANGTIAHAQLVFSNGIGNGMIMLSSCTGQSEMAKHMLQPEEAGSRVTQITCLVAPDAAALAQMAKAARAEFIQELTEMPYGGKAFTLRDPEGHLWSVGEYNPWA